MNFLCTMNNMLKFLQALEPNLTSENLCILTLLHLFHPCSGALAGADLAQLSTPKYEKPTTAMSPPVSVREVGMMMRFLRSCENIAILLLFIIELSARLKANNFQFNQR